MPSDTQDEFGGPICPECPLGESPTFGPEHIDYSAVLNHFLQEHPDSDLLEDVVNGKYIETVCEDCGRSFFAPVSLNSGRLHVDVYCPDCEGEELVRRLMVQEITAAEFVKYEADPVEDNLGEKT